jgi:DNA replication protein DnaC
MQSADFTCYFDSLEDRARTSIKEEQGDYEIDGLLYCHKCNTPKQTRVEFLGMIRTPPCLCKCEVEKREREEAERKRCELIKRIKDNRRIAFPESDMQSWTFENDDTANEKISKVARNYVENFSTMQEQGKGLLFFGTVGTGKSFASACIANALIDKGIPVLMTNFARLSNTLQGMWEGKQEYLDSLNRFPLLILDDLGAERKSEYMNEIVFNLIDSRYRAKLPLIVTTNLTSEELKNPADITNRRTYSRLLEMCIPLEVKGEDRRREKLKDSFKEMKELLGL